MKVELGQANLAAQEWCSEIVVCREQNRRMSFIINCGGSGHQVSDGQSPYLRPGSLQRQASARYDTHSESMSSALSGPPPSSPAFSSPPQDLHHLSVSIHGLLQARRIGHFGSSLSRRTGQRFPVNPQYPHRPLLPPLQAATMNNERSNRMPNTAAWPPECQRSPLLSRMKRRIRVTCNLLLLRLQRI